MKPATLVTAILLVLIALAHVVRLALRIQVTIDGAVVPMWASVVATILPAALAFGLWRENAHARRAAV